MANIDLIVAEYFADLTGRFFILDTFGVIMASYLPFLIGIIALIFIFKQPSVKKKLFSFSFVGLSLIFARGLILEVIRFFYQRPRPFIELGTSPLIKIMEPAFPSGHASFFFAMAFAIFLFNKKWGWWFIVLATLNGAARVFAGVHWVSDILGGVAVGVLSVGLVHLLLQDTMDVLYKSKKKSEVSPKST